MRRVTTSRHRDLLLLAALVAAMVIGSGVCLIGYAWMALNSQEATRETLLVRRTLTRMLDRVASETKSQTAWNEAFEKTLGAFDMAWLDQNYAMLYRDSFNHNLTMVFDHNGRLGYAAKNGDRIALSDAAGLARAVSPLVHQVQQLEFSQRRATARSGRLGSSNLICIPHVIRSGDDVYFVGVSDIAPTDGLIPGAQVASVAVTGKRVDASFLVALQDDLGIRGARLIASGADKAGIAALPGSTGGVTWTLSRPGADVLKHAGGYIGLAALLLGLAMLALAYRIRQLLLRIRDHDAALRSTMNDLVEARDQAQAASVAKSQFVANMSHEIRTPLNGVLGMAQVLARDDLSSTQHDRVKTILQSGNALLTVLNDVLDISKIEAGKLEIDETTFDLTQLIESLCDSYKDLGLTKGVNLTWTVEPAASGLWTGDPIRIRQILSNLVSNALKFTDAGDVHVQAGQTEGQIRVAVSDQGIGIPASKLPHLFEKFSQVDGSATRRFGGTGLGLAISRELAVMMGGGIEVESREYHGSKFTLCLPLKAAVASSAKAAITAPDPAGVAFSGRLRILAAEDNLTNQQVLSTLLECLDADLVIVSNGLEAVEAFEASDFHLILMDMQMPVMNGVDATCMIRAKEREQGLAPTPILALTANAMRHQIEEYEAIGMNGHVAKPIQLDRLLEAIIDAVDASTADTPVRHPGRSEAEHRDPEDRMQA